MDAKLKRKSLRLKHYDYSSNGLYFITICVNERISLFGEIIENRMHLNEAGEMILHWYKELQNAFQHIKTLEYVIMPDHIHFILCIENTTQEKQENLFKIIQWFKTMTTNDYIRHVKNNNWRPFHKRLWHRNYYEHIIRDEHSYDEICGYIENNSYIWQEEQIYAARFLSASAMKYPRANT